MTYRLYIYRWYLGVIAQPFLETSSNDQMNITSRWFAMVDLLTGAFYAGNFREWSINHHIRNVIIPATPSNPSIPYVLSTSKSLMGTGKLDPTGFRWVRNKPWTTPSAPWTPNHPALKRFGWRDPNGQEPNEVRWKMLEDVGTRVEWPEISLMQGLPVVPHKAVAEVSKIGDL